MASVSCAAPAEPTVVGAHGSVGPGVGTGTDVTTTAAAASLEDVLALVRDHHRQANAHQAQVLAHVVQWAVFHPVDDDDEAAGWVMNRVGFNPQIAPLNGEGVPQVCASAVAELGAVLGMSTQTAQGLLADALELAYRLPLLWARVMAGQVLVWRARKIADATSVLSPTAAAFVDRQVAPVAHRVSFSGLDRLVQTAMLQHDPQQYWQADGQRRERRHVLIDIANTSLGGLTSVEGSIDLADALDLEQALNHAAEQRAAWGDTSTPDARKARALGDLARDHLQLTGLTAHSAGPVQIATNTPPTARGTMPPGTPVTITPLPHTTTTTAGQAHASGPATAGGGCGLGTGAPVGSGQHPPAGIDPAPGQAPTRVKPRRQITLYVHLTAADLTNTTAARTSGSDASDAVRFGRVENTRAPVTTDTIRDWCGAPDTSITVRTIIDTTAEYTSTGYAIPDRIREHVRLRDKTCVFPGCHTNGLSCQIDHIEPFNHHDPSSGGPTSTSNLALLCQRHHHLKTFTTGWTYTPLGHGTYQWTTPTGQTILREPNPEAHTYPNTQPPPTPPPTPPPPTEHR